jgi:hypothetical protein
MRWSIAFNEDKSMLDLIADSDYSLNKSVEVLSNRTPSNLDKGRLSEDLDHYIREKEILQTILEHLDAFDLPVFDSEPERP